MRSKLKWGPTIQQNHNMIYVVNLGAEAKRFTHRRCKVLIQCQFLKRGGGGGGWANLPNIIKDVRQVQNRGQAKITKFQYK